METLELKKIIADLLNKGHSLPEIQNILDADYGEKMTFMELRIIASELEDIDWAAGEEDDAEKTVGETDKEEELDEDMSGRTLVELSQVHRPGFVASGTVSFASGAKAEWMLDQFGRLALDNKNGEPTESDLREFQSELQKLLAGG